MSDQGLTIKIGSTADTKGFDQATEGLHRSTEAAHEFVNAIKLGVGIDLGGKLVESLREIPNLLREAVAEGVKFNALMQTSQIAMAGAFKSVDSSLSFAAAKTQGGEALDYLMEKSKALGLDFESVVETFKVNVPTMFQAGIHDAKEMADTIVLLNQVAASKGISGFQAQRDIIDLLNGQGERTILGKELKANGVTNEQLEKWKEQGTLAQNLKEKFSAIAEAGQAFADTFDGNMNRLKTTWAQLLGDLSKPVFEELQQAFKELAAELDSPEGKQGLATLGIEIRDLVHDGVALTEWAAKNADTLVMFGSALKTIGITVAAVKLVDLLAGLTAMPLKLIAGTDALKAQTAALKEHTAAVTTNAAAAAAERGSGAVGSGVGAGSVTAKGGKGVSSVAAKALGALPQIAIAIEVAVAGYSAGKALKENIFDPTSSFALGTLTSGNDMKLAEEQSASGHKKLSEMEDKISAITSDKEWKEVGDALVDYRTALENAKNELGGFEGMQKQVYETQIARASGLLKVHDRMLNSGKIEENSGAKAVHDEELNLQAAAEKQAEIEDANRAANAKHEEARKEADAEREARLANETAVAQAKSASERGDYSTYASDRGEELKKQLAATPSLRDEQGWEGKYTPVEVDKRDKLRAALEADIKQMAKAQEQADMETWKTKSQREEELTRKKIDALKEADKLEEAQGKKRLAELAASHKKELEIAAERKRLEDEIAAKRLGIQMQIGGLEGESSVARQTRQAEYDAAKISRDAKPEKSAERPNDLSHYRVEKGLDGEIERYIPEPQHGEVLDADVTKRRGYVEMPRHSRLEDWKARQSPLLPGPAAHPSDPSVTGAGGTAAAGASGAPSGAGAAAGSAEALEKAINESLGKLTAALTKAAASTTTVGSAAVASAAALQKQIDDLRSRLERAARV